MDISSSATAKNLSLKLGGRSLKVEEAWKFETTEIFAELDKAIDGHSTANNNLRRMRDFIRSLSHPDGDIYASEDLKPPQSITRTVVSGRKDTEDESKFDIEEHDLNDDGIRYWGLCDMLGLLMSHLAEVPEDATKEDYYLHITALYGRWCKTLIGSSKKNLPSMFCSVWVTDSAARAEKIFFGASRGGSTRNASSNSPWNCQIKIARLNILDVEHLKESDYDLDKSPARERRGEPDSVPLGNCAETYPFAYLDKYRGYGEPWQNAHGLALRKDATLGVNYCINDIIRHLWNPCPNCRWYIESRGGKPENFEREHEREGEQRTPHKAGK